MTTNNYAFWNFAVIQVLPFQNNFKNLDLSYKMGLDFCWLFWREKYSILKQKKYGSSKYGPMVIKDF